MEFNHLRLPVLYDDTLGKAFMISSQQPFIICVRDLTADYPTHLHWHDAYEIGYVIRGAGLFVHDDEVVPLQAGQVYITNDTRCHTAFSLHFMQLGIIHFLPSLLQDADFHSLSSASYQPFTIGSVRFTPFLPIEHEATNQIRGLIQAILAEHQQAASNWQLITKGLVLQIIGLLRRHFISTSHDPKSVYRETLLKRLAPVLRLIEERFMADLSVEAMANLVALSPSHFNSIFREALNQSPIAYRNTRRIAYARHSLITTDDPIALVAERSGFATPQQFNRLFYRLTGMTPGTYRQKAVGHLARTESHI
jgi:AraC-like DNA-binding protein